ncbi:MAG: hypothetical protein ACREX9_00130 [Gammaproteobacteria bacterium]
MLGGTSDKDARVQKDSVRFSVMHESMVTRPLIRTPPRYELRLRSDLATKKVGVGAMAGAWDIE